MAKSTGFNGFAIVVVDRGFVYVGAAKNEDGWTTITNARNIRRWGTTKGLGQLAIEGPQADTVLDECGTVRVPPNALITLLDTAKALWAKK